MKCVNHMYSRIQAALLPVIAQEIRTHAGFQKIPEKEIATCAPVSTEGEVKAGEDTAELRFQFSFFFLKKKQDVFTKFPCDLRRLCLYRRTRVTSGW